jgi:hypothetical protein
VCDLDRGGHQVVRLVGRVAEHHPLVARADAVDRVTLAALRLKRLVDALGDVGRLLVERHHHTACLGVEAEGLVPVADLRDPVPRETRDVDVRLGRDLTRDDDEPRRDERLAGNAPVRIVLEDGVENAVRDLVGDLVRVPFRDRLRREQELARRDAVGAHPGLSP